MLGGTGGCGNGLVRLCRGVHTGTCGLAKMEASHRTTQAMSEEQLKTADTDAALEQDYAELSDE